MMSDWLISNYVDSSLRGTWVYYKNPAFPQIHFSRCVDDPTQDHMATNDRTWYYYGVTNTFNDEDVPDHIALDLENAWTDYFTVT